MKKERVVYFDLLNIVACIAVVFLHSNVMVFDYTPGKNWALGLGIEVLFYWAVPIFLMLSGANLLKYRERYDTATFFKKRVAKTFIPFILWSIILYILRYAIEKGELSSSFGISEFFALFFSNNIESVYWFFFPLFALYIAMPALSLLANNRKALLYLALTAFVLQSCIPDICALFHLPWNPSIQQPMVTTFVFFAIIGYLCSTHSFSKQEKLIIYALGLLALVFRYAYTFIASSQANMLDTTFFRDYGSFVGVLPSIAIFVLFKTKKWPDLIQSNAKLLAKISGCSFGVYLVHQLVLRDFLFCIAHVPMNSILLRTIGPIVIWLVCVLFVLLIKKIPLLNKIVP